jgi:hypothetical protein
MKEMANVHLECVSPPYHNPPAPLWNNPLPPLLRGRGMGVGGCSLLALCRSKDFCTPERGNMKEMANAQILGLGEGEGWGELKFGL